MSSNRLKKELKKKGDWDSAEQEAYLNLLRTHSLVTVRFDRLFREHGITSPQYNILRILRGHDRKEGLPSLEIAGQMIAVVPDITRVLDRLEKGEYVQRERCPEDRRVVRVKLTAGGKRLLAKLDSLIREVEKTSFGHMTKKDLRELSRLLAKARDC